MICESQKKSICRRLTIADSSNKVGRAASLVFTVGRLSGVSKCVTLFHGNVRCILCAISTDIINSLIFSSLRLLALVSQPLQLEAWHTALSMNFFFWRIVGLLNRPDLNAAPVIFIFKLSRPAILY
ncbi:hypothetical protein K439DRAFT_196538 [Ramaria rubella]|nr:hypothetical protein K439DRAFT_196538 [Ramaria rubella]